MASEETRTRQPTGGPRYEFFCGHDVGEWRSTHLHLQPRGFSSLCGINRGGARLAGGYHAGQKNMPDTFFPDAGYHGFNRPEGVPS